MRLEIEWRISFIISLKVINNFELSLPNKPQVHKVPSITKSCSTTVTLKIEKQHSRFKVTLSRQNSPHGKSTCFAIEQTSSWQAPKTLSPLNVNFVFGVGISFNTITEAKKSPQMPAERKVFLVLPSRISGAPNATFNLIFDCEKPIVKTSKEQKKNLFAPFAKL